MMYKRKASLFTCLLAGALGIVFLTTGLAFAAAPADTISWWKLDETIPDVPTDPGTYTDSVGIDDGESTGTGHLLSPTPSNPLDPDAAQVGGAQVFDGSDTGIDVEEDNGSFDWGLNDSFSIEYWVKRAAIPFLTNEVVVGREDTGIPQLLLWTGITTAELARLYLRDNNGVEFIVTGTKDVVDGAWHHVVAVRDADIDELRLYVDGNEDATPVPATYGAGFDSITAELNIGWLNLAPFYHFNGTLDEVAIYSRALTPTEIQDHYNNGLEGHGIDYVAPVVPAPPAPPSSGGGGGGGCFIGTTAW